MNQINNGRLCDYERVDLWLRWIYDETRDIEHRMGLVRVFNSTASPHMRQIAERTMIWDIEVKTFWANYRN